VEGAGRFYRMYDAVAERPELPACSAGCCGERIPVCSTGPWPTSVVWPPARRSSSTCRAEEGRRFAIFPGPVRPLPGGRRRARDAGTRPRRPRRRGGAGIEFAGRRRASSPPRRRGGLLPHVGRTALLPAGRGAGRDRPLSATWRAAGGDHGRSRRGSPPGPPSPSTAGSGRSAPAGVQTISAPGRATPDSSECRSSAPARSRGSMPCARADVGYCAGAPSGSCRTTTVSATWMISSTGRSAAPACSRIFSGFDAW
jgi:hypothetical protein